MKLFPMLVGTVVGVSFFDHSIGSDAELVECQSFGKIISITTKEILIEHWSVFGDDLEIVEENRERVAIVKDCIFEVIEYTPKRAKRFF